MGWKSSLLLGDPALLSQLFPGWKPPLRPPVRRLNPFTRERETVEVLRVRGKAYRRALSEPGGGSTVVLELTERFVEALSVVTPESVRDVAGGWSADMTGENLTRTVETMRRMASDAMARKCFLYLVNEV